ncbi:MAG: hydroxyacylglutathione hydrolase, partial [Erythrobacter sp.]|uniref:hydroxyacylglutathione hydrolase n=1 Tax=Erythrobacter sp. TaxID=1042 RepID=UPI0025FB006F
AIDTPDAKAYLLEADMKGWKITQIWNTHWHPDHAGGNAHIQEETGCTILGPAELGGKFPVDRTIGNGDVVKIGGVEARVIDVSGHTNGHIALHLAEAGIAFVGDSVFALGCGRMFEGEAGQFWDSLSRIKALPPETLLYCAHEYTASNAKFALHADPENVALQDYVDEITAKREKDEPTVPTTLRRELATNPFLRADDPEMMARWGGSTPAETFAALRAAKDRF